MSAQVSPFDLHGFHPNGEGSSLTHTEKPGLFEDSLWRLPTTRICVFPRAENPKCLLDSVFGLFCYHSRQWKVIWGRSLGK